MTWQREWEAIAARIDGIQVASGPLIATLQKNNDDATGSSGQIMQIIDRIKGDIKTLVDRNRSTIPNDAIRIMDDYCNSAPSGYVPGNPLATLTSRLTGLLAIQPEVHFIISRDTPKNRGRSALTSHDVQNTKQLYGDRWQVVRELDTGRQGRTAIVVDLLGNGEDRFVLKEPLKKPKQDRLQEKQIRRFRDEVRRSVLKRALQQDNSPGLQAWDPLWSPPRSTEFVVGRPPSVVQVRSTPTNPPASPPHPPLPAARSLPLHDTPAARHAQSSQVAFR